jgi:hypothetical protein
MHLQFILNLNNPGFRVSCYKSAPVLNTSLSESTLSTKDRMG